VFGTRDFLVMVTPLVDGTATALVLDNAATVRATPGDDASRKLGVIGGGVGAASAAAPFQQSFATGVAGYGLFVSGMSLVVAEVGTRTGPR
jgi:hypothetical protein